MNGSHTHISYTEHPASFTKSLYYSDIVAIWGYVYKTEHPRVGRFMKSK